MSQNIYLATFTKFKYESLIHTVYFVVLVFISDVTLNLRYYCCCNFVY